MWEPFTVTAKLSYIVTVIIYSRNLSHVTDFLVVLMIETSLEPPLSWIDSVHSLISLISCLLRQGLPGVFFLSDFLNEKYSCICNQLIFTARPARPIPLDHHNNTPLKKTNFKAPWCLSVRPSLHMGREENPTRCHWMVYCTYNMLNMFRSLLCPSSGFRDYMFVLLLPMVCSALIAGCWRSGAGQQASICKVPHYLFL